MKCLFDGYQFNECVMRLQYVYIENAEGGSQTGDFLIN
jgi:hypothetical protein